MEKNYLYLIKSDKPTMKGKIYFGVTNNPIKRFKQHNGIIDGGAMATVMGRPWLPICIIKGFENREEALKLEWRLNHPPYRRKKPNMKNALSLLEEYTRGKDHLTTIELKW